MADLNTYLFEIHQGLKAQGHELDDDTLRELAKAVQHPQLMQQLQSGQVTTRQIVEQAMQGLQTIRQRRGPHVRMDKPAMDEDPYARSLLYSSRHPARPPAPTVEPMRNSLWNQYGVPPNIPGQLRTRTVSEPF